MKYLNFFEKTLDKLPCVVYNIGVIYKEVSNMSLFIKVIKSVIIFLYITGAVFLENIQKLVNTVKLICIILRHNYKKAIYTRKHGKFYIQFIY